MMNSRKNRWIGGCVGLLLSACASSPYRVLFQDDTAAELSVPPDRILLECQDLYDADTKGLYGFMLHVLDEKRQVITFVQGNTLDKESCENRIKGIGKVLREAKHLYIAGRGNMNTVDETAIEEYVFPGKGKFRSSGRSVSFVAIANEHGLCFDAYSGFRETPCPPEPFPLWKHSQDSSR